MNTLRSLLAIISLIAMLAFATAGTAAMQADDHDLPQPLVEGMINELLDRLSANADGATIKTNGLDALIAKLESRNRKGETSFPGVVTKKMDESAAEDGKKDNH